MRLFLLCGKARSGKNLFAQVFQQELTNKGYRVLLLQITKPLYQYARDYFGWNGLEEEKPRTFLQHMGIEVIQKQLGMKNFLVDRLCQDITILDSFFDIGIITDGRLIEEFELLKKRYPGVKIIRIRREEEGYDLTEEEKNHITEKDLDRAYSYDYEIWNSSRESLLKEVRQIIEREVIE